MSCILDQKVCLNLNANWLPIRFGTVREAILAMNAEGGGAAVALDIVYGELPDGSWDFESGPEYLVPTKWEEWLSVPLRDYDEVVRSPKMTIRAPVVTISTGYHHMPVCKFRPSKRVIYERDKGVCQYSGEKLSLASSSLDHIHPKSLGGKDTFENLVLCSPKINSAKGNKSNKEAGLKLLRQPKAPPVVPMVTLITEARHRDHQTFLFKHRR